MMGCSRKRYSTWSESTLYVGSFLSDLDVFSIDPLWPGLAVSLVVFGALNMKEKEFGSTGHRNGHTRRSALE